MRNVLWIACGCALLIGASLGVWLLQEQVSAQDTTQAGQDVLGPGLYVFQTRTRSSTCGDAERDGFVLSCFASINGVSGSTTMSMELLNNPHFKNWKLSIDKNATLTAESRLGVAGSTPEARFSVTRDGDRWTGTGVRFYAGKKQGKPARCQVSYDALLRRIDTR